jgi:hypothetical protein
LILKGTIRIVPCKDSGNQCDISVKTASLKGETRSRDVPNKKQICSPLNDADERWRKCWTTTVTKPRRIYDRMVKRIVLFNDAVSTVAAIYC